MTVVSALVVVVALAALGGQGVRGNRVVDVQLDPHTVHDASIDDAFYDCIDIQAHSLVRPGQGVTLSTTNLADVVTMIKGFGSWVTVADPASRADVTLTLHDGTAGPGTCLGTTVVATYRGPDGRTTVRVGTGAQVPGQGPPPAPPL
jgi:hypothetical protein